LKRRRKSNWSRSLHAIIHTLGEYTQKTAVTLGHLANHEWGALKDAAVGVKDEVAAVLISLNLYPLGLVNFDRMEVLSSVVPKRPVLLIHGYFHNNSVFYIMKRRLRHEGWPHVYTINLHTTSQGIEECAQDIAKRVDEILGETGADKVDLIGHSFGGLCARYFVQALGGADKVGHCICVGTPHGGSTLAFLGFGTANLDMQLGSDILMELNQELALPKNVEFTNIWSPFDYMVIPIESAIMEGRVRNIKIDFVGHLGLLFCIRVFNEIFLTLSSDSIHRKLTPKHLTQRSRKSVNSRLKSIS